MVCELCGKHGQEVRALVEGTELTVCPTCARFGKILQKPVVKAPKVVAPKKEVLEVVVPEYAKLVREAREKSGMTQKEFARMLNEKESVLQKIENGTFVPPISMAKKLEKLLKIKLVTVEEEEKTTMQKTKSGTLTIGDIIKAKL